MRENARASLLSLHGNGSARSTMYSRDGALSDDAHAPILQNAAPKGSGLRHYVDDASSEYDDSVMMQPSRKVDGRF